MARVWPRGVILVFTAGLCTLLSACDVIEALLRSLPAARTPVLETIFNADSRQVIPLNPSADFSVGIAGRLELRVRAPAPTRMKVAVEGMVLPEVRDGAAHPELAQSGYFRVSDPVPVSKGDPLEFWRVLVVLPLNIGPSSPFGYTIALSNLSLNPYLTEPERVSRPLLVKVRPALEDDNEMTLPSEVFFDPPDNKHPRSALIAQGVTVAGWLAADLGRGDEDMHGAIWPDNDFIERNYRATDPTLSSSVIPGRCYTDIDCLFHPNLPIPLTGGGLPNAGTYIIPGQPNLTIELNTWHLSKNQGNKPSRWINDPDPANTNWAWPFDPRFGVDKAAGADGLNAGDYVIVSGALVQDTAHLHWDAPPPYVDLNDNPDYRRGWCWQRKRPGHGGWLEIHPFDSVRKVGGDSAPRQRKHAQMVELCDPDDGRPVPSANVLLAPVEPPPTSRSVLRFRELIDPRFTDMSTVTLHSVGVDSCDPTKLRVQVVIQRTGWFEATYLLWWEEGETTRPAACVPRHSPPPASDDDDPSACRLKPSLPQCRGQSDAL